VTRVRARDLRCCITGGLVAGNDYTGFEAAHIFPLSETDIVSPLVASYRLYLTWLQVEQFELQALH
jgi:hypothetical protein